MVFLYHVLRLAEETRTTIILISSSTIRKIKENNFVTQSLAFYGFNTVYTFLIKILFFQSYFAFISFVL